MGALWSPISAKIKRESSLKLAASAMSTLPMFSTNLNYLSIFEN